MVQVFITHSSVDKRLAEGLVDTITAGGGLPTGMVFCSSMDGIDVPSGDDFIACIKRQLQSTTLVVPLITPAYLDSMFCMWELGAIWCLEIKMSPIRVGAVKPESLPELLRNRQVKTIGKPGLNAIVAIIEGQGGPPRNHDLWEARRDSFIEKAESMTRELERDWLSTPQAKQRARARIGSAVGLLHEALGRIRDAGYVAMTANESPDRAFQLTLKEMARAFATLFVATTGVPVRITIKQVIRSGATETGADELFVEDLVRDKAAIRKTRERVVENSDFESIVVNKHNNFFSNDLQTQIDLGRYKNSHIRSGEPLEYQSAIVWPIRKIYDGPGDALGFEVSEGQDLVAFLCLDSPKKNAFSEQDVELGAGLAAALYSVLRPALYEEIEEEDADI